MKLPNFIICDDVRREVGNKRTIVGAYADKIIFSPTAGEPLWPVSKQMGLYFTLQQEDKDPEFNEFDFDISLNDQALGKIHGEMDEQPIPNSMVVDFVIPLTFKEPGTLKIKIRFLLDGKTVIDDLSPLEIEVIESQPQKV